MTKTKAMRQARRESTIYRQGRGRIVSTYSPAHGCHYVSVERPWPQAREHLTCWRLQRTLELLGYEGEKFYSIYYEGDQAGGRLEDRVSAALASA